MTEAWKLIGKPRENDVLLVVDHASNHVPPDIDLGIEPHHLEEHIAWDLGVADIAERLVSSHNYCAFLGTASRLVADLNRYPHEDDVMPPVSDGIEVSANSNPSEAVRQQRLDRFFHPYHENLASLVKEYTPRFILAVHSFSPTLRSQPDLDRPWHVGVMYNDDGRGARLALDYLETLPLTVGDQKPYSGRQLNATMNRHAETRGIPYTGIEIRQDLLTDGAGIRRWSDNLHAMLLHIQSSL